VSDERVTRLMGWIGLLTLISFVVGFGVWAQIYVIAFALTFVLLFAAQLRHVLHDATNVRRVWPDLVFAAGLIYLAVELAKFAR
jgi:hypothetical protein